MRQHRLQLKRQSCDNEKLRQAVVIGVLQGFYSISETSWTDPLFDPGSTMTSSIQNDEMNAQWLPSKRS